MNEEIIKKLKTFIKENPPLDEEGEPKYWSTSDWEKNLDKEIPNWKVLLKRENTWMEIKGIKPRRNYDYLLDVILRYAPPKIMKEYITSDDLEERKEAYRVLIGDNAKKLTVNFWERLDNDTKIWLISKISEEVLKRPHLRFWDELDDILYDPEDFFEIIKRHGHLPWIYPYIMPLALTEAAFYEALDIIHPLWIKLKATIEKANDLSSMKRIGEIESKFKERVQKILQSQHPFVSKNVLFDPSLLLDYEKAKKAFGFMGEYRKEFNFFIPSSFYEALKEENKWYKFARFFECEKENSPREILGMLEEHKQYYTLFEIPRELYQKKYTYFYESLHKEIEDRDLVEILFEEWVFLQEFSWIVAKSKKVFEKFKESGAVTIEISKNALDKSIEKLARHKINKMDDEILSTIEKLRGLGKWIAHGGITVMGASYSNPILGALSGYLIGEGLLVLIDPEEIMEDRGDIKWRRRITSR